MTGSIAEPCPDSPRRPLLRRLTDILPPPPTATTPEPLPAPAPPVDPAAVRQAERVVRAAVEILGGRRPARQLNSVLRPDLLTYLVELQAAAKPLRPQVRKVLTRRQGGGILEVVALITISTGVRALAARFEHHGGEPPRTDTGRWRCTALQLRLTTGDLAAHRRR